MNNQKAELSPLKIARAKLEDLEKKVASYTALEIPYKLAYELEKARQEVAEREGAELKDRYAKKEKIKIDRGLIIGYNLTSLIREFKKSFEDLYEGAFAFCIGGDREIIDKYVIERLHRELKNYTEQRPCKKVEIPFFSEDLGKDTELIEYKLKHHRRCDDLHDFFEDGSNADILLIIWNDHLPCKEIEEVAFAAWANFREKTEKFIKDKSRILIVIWVNTDPNNHLEGFTFLPIPSKFDIPKFKQWFRGRLIHAGLSNEEVNDYWERIESCHGDLVATYRELQYIIRELQGGTGRYE